MNGARGFSIIELLIVVVIIGLVAAIAVPNLLAARRAANEATTVSGLRTLFGANHSFSASIGNGSYAGTPATVGVSSLNELANAGLIDNVLGLGFKSGYSYLGDRTIATPTEPETFYFATNPSTASGVLMTGTKRFGVATDGVIRYDASAGNLGVPFDAATLAAASPTEP